MNKKVNTVLFVLGASVLNVLLIIIFFLLSLALIAAIFPADTESGQFLMILAFVVSVVVSYGVYGFLIRKLANSIEMEKYFHPIFKKKR